MLASIKRKSVVALMALSLAVGAHSTFAAEKLALEKQGIKVWTTLSENNPMAQYRAETMFNTSLENAAGLILDTERGATWIPNVSQIKVIERNDKGSFIAYMVLKMPFPLANRDLVIKGDISKDTNGRIIIKNQAIKDSRLPEKEGLVRIQKYEGDWIFERISDQQVKVTTRGYADPGGAIPKKIVNSFVQQQPYQMFIKMKHQVKLTNYTQKDLPKVLQ